MQTIIWVYYLPTVLMLLFTLLAFIEAKTTDSSCLTVGQFLALLCLSFVIGINWFCVILITYYFAEHVYEKECVQNFLNAKIGKK